MGASLAATAGARLYKPELRLNSVQILEKLLCRAAGSVTKVADCLFRLKLTHFLALSVDDIYIVLVEHLLLDRLILPTLRRENHVSSAKRVT